jgi:hypothetical protein
LYAINAPQTAATIAACTSARETGAPEERAARQPYKPIRPSPLHFAMADAVSSSIRSPALPRSVRAQLAALEQGAIWPRWDLPMRPRVVRDDCDYG